MKVWVYVEGESDRRGLGALWRQWQEALRAKGIGIKFVVMRTKGVFLKDFGQHAAATLVDGESDLVVALPDLYPNKDYATTAWRHADLEELRGVLRRSVEVALATTHGIPSDEILRFLDRLHASAMKHDFEVLLLAAVDQLRIFLGTNDALAKQWRHPVEDQDQERPPKHIVGDLVRKHRKKAYRDTIDAPAVLSKVEKIGAILRDERGRIECLVFKGTLDWLGEKTGVPAYSFAQGLA